MNLNKESLIDLIQNIKNCNKDISETQTINSFIIPILELLGWNIRNCKEVIFEDSTSTNKRIDMRFQSESTHFLVEAKKRSVNLNDKDFEQLTNYLNSDSKADFGILTNSVDYWIADNRKYGLENKRIYNFSIFEIRDCDLEILEYFSRDSKDLKIIDEKIKYIELGQKLGEKTCKSLILKEKTKTPHQKSEIKTTNSSLKKYFEIEYSEKNIDVSLFKEKIELFLNLATKKIDTKEIEINFSTFLSKNKKIIMDGKNKGKPYTSYFIKKFNLYLMTQLSNKQKLKYLEIIDNFLKELFED